MSKEKWLKRCENIYNMGLAKEEVLQYIEPATAAYVSLRQVHAQDSRMFYPICIDHQGNIGEDSLTVWGSFDRHHIGEQDPVFPLMKIAAMFTAPSPQEMTREEWLERCAKAFDAGMGEAEMVGYLDKVMDTYVRFRYVLSKHPNAFDQVREAELGAAAIELLDERGSFDKSRTLAQDPAYKTLEMMAVLVHPCQKCAEDPDAWHTRSGFCTHSKGPVGSEKTF